MSKNIRRIESMISFVTANGIKFIKSNTILFRILRKLGVVEPMNFKILIENLIPELIWKRGGSNTWVCNIGSDRYIIHKSSNYMIVVNGINLDTKLPNLDSAKDYCKNHLIDSIYKKFDNNKIINNEIS